MRANAGRRRRKKKKTTKRRRTRRNMTHRATVTNRRRKTTRRTQAAANRRRKRRRVKRRSTRRNWGYRRNQAGKFGRDFMNVVRVGGAVTVGFVAQKALTRLLVDTGLFDKLGETAKKYSNTIAGALVAALGVPIITKVAPGDAKMVGAGMGAGFVHTALMDVLKATGQTKIITYLGDYTEAEGSAMYSGYGAYYEFEPHQVFDGMGEYYTSPGMSGFGQLEAGQLTQAAAAYGQAPGGPAQLHQAAAGMGEYLIVGAKGIGEYEEVTPEYTRPVPVDEGISPDLTSAEQALSIAEAAAGVGAYGDQTVPLQSTVNPTGWPEAIPDQPGGSRAGTLAGNNGIFGATH